MDQQAEAGHGNKPGVKAGYGDKTGQMKKWVGNRKSKIFKNRDTWGS